MPEKLQVVGATLLLAVIALGAAPPAPAAPPQESAQHRGQMMGMMAREMGMSSEIAKLTDEMNKATGDAKIDAMARLLTALVKQHSMMMEHMKMMHDEATGRASGPGEAPHAEH